MQVLEQNIKWKAAVMQTTLHSAGTAVLPHKKVIMEIIASLFAAPSKVRSFFTYPVHALILNACALSVDAAKLEMNLWFRAG